MSMAELVEAGAPELPEGWFYRVGEDGFGGIEVEIRKQRKRFGSRRLVGVWVDVEAFDTAPAALADACSRAFDSARAQAARQTRYGALAAFVGDHDPKGGR